MDYWVPKALVWYLMTTTVFCVPPSVFLRFLGVRKFLEERGNSTRVVLTLYLNVSVAMYSNIPFVHSAIVSVVSHSVT